jgi:outer membrane biosynthesis protein TonB
MTGIALRRDEGLALLAALAAHAALVLVLALQPASTPLPPPERMTVTLSDEVGLTSTSPEPAAPAAADEAPELGEDAAPPPPTLVPPQPAPTPAPRPAPVPQPKAAAQPAKPAPAKAQPAKAAAVQPAPAKAAPAKAPVRPGASRIGDDFLKGTPGGTAKAPPGPPPAAAVGPAVRSALAGAISRQLKPKWVAPQGAEAELLVTILTWDLNADGTLAGSPRLVRQEGITAANRAQAQRHVEQAIRAVRLAAPFNLPDEFYPAWKRVTAFRFDRKLSQ